MNYEKNLIGEKKATFRTLDITAQLNIDIGSFLSSVAIVYSGSMSASRADFDYLYADRFRSSQRTFN